VRSEFEPEHEGYEEERKRINAERAECAETAEEAGRKKLKESRKIRKNLQLFLPPAFVLFVYFVV
jgi:hypothetical protein